MRRKYIFIAIVLCVSFIPFVGKAQVKGLLISPQRIVFERDERVREIRLVNRGDSPQKYRISLVNRQMMKDGQLEPAETPADNEFFADKVLRYAPRQVELGPKEAQSIKLMSRLTADSPDGEYRSHIVIQEIPKAGEAESASKTKDYGGIGVNVRAIFGVSIPVFFRKGDLKAEVSLSDPSVVQKGESTYVSVNINRKGNKSIFGTAKVLSVDKEIAILKGIAVYLSVPSRTVLIEIPEEYAKSLKGKNLRVTFGAVDKEEDSPSAEVSFTG